MTNEESARTAASLKADYEAKEALARDAAQDRDKARQTWLEYEHRFVLHRCSTVYQVSGKRCENLAAAGSSMCDNCSFWARSYSWQDEQDRINQGRIG